MGGFEEGGGWDAPTPPNFGTGNLVAGSITASASGLPNLPGAQTIATPIGVDTGKLWDWAGAVYNVKAAGVVIDGVTDVNCAITNGTPNLSTTTSPGPFLASDVGRQFKFAGAGAAGVVLTGTVLAFVDSKNLTLSVNAGTSVVAGTRGFSVGTDNATAINATVTAASTAGGGTVLLPGSDIPGRGIYFDTAILPVSNVAFRGVGINGTVLYPSVSLTGNNGNGFSVVIPVSNPYANFVSISDLTIDCSAQYVDGVLGGLVGAYSNAIHLQGVHDVTIERVRIVKPFGFGIVVGTVAGAAPHTTNVKIDTVFIEAERNGNDSIGGGGNDNFSIQNVWVYPHADGTGVYGTAIDHTNTINTHWHNIFAKTNIAVPVAASVLSDFGATYLIIDGVWSSGFKQGIVIASTASGQAAHINIRDIFVATCTQVAIFFNTTAGFGIQDFEIKECVIQVWDTLGTANPAIDLQGGHDGEISGNRFGAVTTAYCIRIRGDAGSVAANAPTWVSIHDNDVRQATNKIFLQYLGAAPVGIYCYNNPGFNPQGGGVGTPAFPITTVAQQNTSGIEVYAYVTNGTSAMTVVLTSQGGSKTITIPASAFGLVVIPANETFTPTYAAGAPSWVWYAN